jgi:hypothetical protein
LTLISDRQLRRLLKTLDEEGVEGLVNKNTGQAGHHRKPDEEKNNILILHKELYPDSGSSLFSDLLQERHNISVSSETLRRWLAEDGQIEITGGKVTHRRRRVRKPCLGYLTQLDTSDHDWFKIGTVSHLILFIDDATNAIDGNFAETDSTLTNMAAIKGYIERHGCPMSFYVDKASHFKVNKGEKSEDIVSLYNKKETQIERALNECGIQVIHAHSPQAKGRVERKFRTLQDRLVKRLNYDNIKDIRSANEYLRAYYFPLHNAKFTCAPTSSVDIHKPPTGLDLDAIFSIHVERVVTNDFTFSLDNVKYQIESNNDLHWLRRKKVLIEKRLDGSLRVRHVGGYLLFRKIDH